MTLRYLTSNTHGNESAMITAVSDDPNQDVEINLFTGTDGAVVVQVDVGSTDQPVPIRVNVNEGELATIENGGERITLPEHWGEFVRPDDATLEVSVWTLTVEGPDSKSPRTSVHGSEAECFEVLRVNHVSEEDTEYALENNLDLTLDGELITYLTEYQAFVLTIEDHTLRVSV